MPAALFLSGLSALLAGAFIRACQPSPPIELLASFCGPAPQGALVALLHQHCAGCGVMFAGIAAMLAAPLLAGISRPRVHAR